MDRVWVQRVRRVLGGSGSDGRLDDAGWKGRFGFGLSRGAGASWLNLQPGLGLPAEEQPQVLRLRGSRTARPASLRMTAREFGRDPLRPG